MSVRLEVHYMCIGCEPKILDSNKVEFHIRDLSAMFMEILSPVGIELQNRNISVHLGQNNMILKTHRQGHSESSIAD